MAVGARWRPIQKLLKCDYREKNQVVFQNENFIPAKGESRLFVRSFLPAMPREPSYKVILCRYLVEP